MLRTQIYLPEELSQELKLLAQRESKPAARVVRELLCESLKRRNKKRNAGTVLREIASLAGHGPGDLSTNLFDYLYGKKSDYARKKRK